MEKDAQEANKEVKEDQSLLHSFKGEAGQPFFTTKLIVMLVVAAVLGVGTGYVLTTRGSAGITTSSTSLKDASSAKKGMVVGSNDTKTFKDAAEGVLKNGGVDGEGQYHLERTGGESQNVYMTSSAVDLSLFVGKKIKVWGETQTAKTAGWLMDVGKVEVLE